MLALSILLLVGEEMLGLQHRGEDGVVSPGEHFVEGLLKRRCYSIEVALGTSRTALRAR